MGKRMILPFNLLILKVFHAQKNRVRIEKINSDALRDFSEAERQEFERYLRRMYRNLTGMPLD